MSVFVPAFDEDLETVVMRAGAAFGPTYLRLGRGENPKAYVPSLYAPWRQLTEGGGAVVIAVGPLAGSYIEAFSQISTDERPNLWVLTELPLERNPIPHELWTQIASAGVLCVVEEHVRRGSFGSEFALTLAEQGRAVQRFVHLCARAHLFDRYGSQGWLRRQSGLDAQAVIDHLGST
jgi:transketolase